MKRELIAGMIAGAFALMVQANGAVAQPAPEFKFAKPAEELPKEVEWKASAEGGLIVTTGNSQARTVAGAFKGSRIAGKDKFEFTAAGAYARSSIFVAVDGNVDGAISADEIQRPSTTSTKAWEAKGRYDRFLTKSNSLYLAALVSGDTPAGKEFVGGGQFGYSRRIFKNDKHELVSEVGYDFSYENLVAGNGVSIHSARLFAGYMGKLTDDTGVSASAEALLNVNELSTPVGEVSPLEDTRLVGKTELTTKLVKNISFSFAFQAKYDNAPAPRAPFGIPYEMGFLPLSDKLDTITKATLIVNFL